MISNILATDMKGHFDLIARIKIKFEEKGSKYIEEIISDSKD